jgi:hypothetical protein
MPIEDVLLAALIERFGDRGLRTGTPPEPIAVFAPKHPEVGEVSVSALAVGPSSIGETVSATVAIGEIIVDSFRNFDSHLSLGQKAERVTKDIVRFLEELFADRLLFWKATDYRGGGGWRERGSSGHTDPLVLDDRTYRTYLWSAPLATWRATPHIFARGWIRDEREYQILLILLSAVEPGSLSEAERELAEKLVSDYERDHTV